MKKDHIKYVVSLCLSWNFNIKDYKNPRCLIVGSIIIRQSYLQYSLQSTPWPFVSFPLRTPAAYQSQS